MNLAFLDQTDIMLHRPGISTLPDDELADYPIVHNIIKALQKWKPDAVIVATPTLLHLDIPIAAAQMGCRLLVEKPISNIMHRVATLQEAVKESKIALLVG